MLWDVDALGNGRLRHVRRMLYISRSAVNGTEFPPSLYGSLSLWLDRRMHRPYD
ncbi:hypothetical protein [Polynucleobacter yangtzensis]|uniref:hypothetical protein n=1 Tax=Polynucleobacter yangtzensis TaxID=1743159 RepID=UPI0013725AFB|nr:hypothetical protein [Polynucleobacter yangtzensis]